MAPAEEVFGGIAMHFQRLNTRCCDEFWAGGGGYGYHSQTGGVVRECLVRLLEILCEFIIWGKECFSLV
jgi:hypothetical protein